LNKFNLFFNEYLYKMIYIFYLMIYKQQNSFIVFLIKIQMNLKFQKYFLLFLIIILLKISKTIFHLRKFILNYIKLNLFII